MVNVLKIWEKDCENSWKTHWKTKDKGDAGMWSPTAEGGFYCLPTSSMQTDDSVMQLSNSGCDLVDK